ncbi:MAG TPA: TetR/AcrR family transcriptional regulator [Candidatus Krumholzibacterium sp.]|nr:TetR/AcrR family transcriptional regulator [Candidatus Krumholzibacterium sp.]
MSRKKAEQQARRDCIVDAARLLLAEKPVEDVSMDDIAGKVDYTRRTLYSYFKSRDEIYLAVLIGDMRSRWALQKAALAEAETGLDKIVRWGESLFDYTQANPVSTRLNVWWDLRGIDRSKIGEEIFAEFEQINEELAEGLRGIFQLGIRDGSLRDDLDVDMCISQYLYSLRAVLHRARSRGYSFARFDQGEYVMHFLDLFTRGIRNTKGRSK